MTALRIMSILVLAALMAAILPARAKTVHVRAGEIVPLQAVLDAALPGDVVRLGAGVHRGPLTIAFAITLEGETGAMVEGNGEGSVITVTGAGAIVRALTVSGSGKSIETLDSGVFLDRTARGARVENNVITGNLYGVYLQGAADALVRGNRITGLSDGWSAQAGNGVHVWNAPGAKVVGNEISRGRDGIFTNASRNNVFAENRFSGLRFAVHYMYTNDSEIRDNVSTGNAVGYAIMYSDRLKVAGNRSVGDRDYGLLLNTSKGSEITGNSVSGAMQPRARWTEAGRIGDTHGTPVTSGTTTEESGGYRLGPEKCVFIYNANRNRFSDNRFENCAIGIHFTAGSEGNLISGNAFINNRNQVKYVGSRYLEWSAGGRGNFWSDNPAFDLDGDGIGDTPYRPNDLIDRVMWIAPQSKILVNSPAVQVIRWAQEQFPALLPGGVTDSRPLMNAPQGKAALQ